MSNHTPGPWKIEVAAYLKEGRPAAYKVNGLNKRLVVGWCEKNDAELIAAAPDMLEALEYLLTRLDTIEDIRIAQDAIAKAKGENG